jgi:ATP-dependent DNA helicase RecQ
LIAGDGETNVLHLNSLDFDRWKDKTEKDKKWINTYGKGFERLEKLRAEKDENQQFNFDILQTYSSIKFLEREGFLFYIQSAGQFSKLFVPLNKEELYRFIVEHPGTDRLLKEVMRSYSGVFTDYININETLLSKRAEMKREDVIKKLSYFDKQKVISYIPIKTKPQLVFAYERLSTEHIQLSNDNYQNLKESSEKRLDAMLDFITNMLECRSKQLLEYFGEKKPRRCGICDICITKNKVDLNEIEFNAIENVIKENLSKESKHLYELISAIEDFKEEDIIQVVRWLIDNNKVVRYKDESLSWYNQLDIGFD